MAVSNGVRVEFDSVAFAKQWNPGVDEAKLGSAVIPIFHVLSREEVDRVMSENSIALFSQRIRRWERQESAMAFS